MVMSTWGKKAAINVTFTEQYWADLFKVTRACLVTMARK